MFNKLQKNWIWLRSGRHAGILPVLLLTALLALACSPKGAGRLPAAGAEREAATESLHAAILDAYRQGDVEQARSLSVQLLEAAPAFHSAPQLRRRLAESYMEEARWDLALHHIGRLLEDYPDSEARWAGLLLRAQALAHSGRRLEGATGLDRALASWPGNRSRDRALTFLAGLVDRGLGAGELEEFRRRRPHSPMAARAGLALAERHLRENRPDEARPLLESAAADAGLGALRDHARDLLSRLGLPDGTLVEQQAVPAREGLIGVLAPLSGRFGVYGEAFLDGARLALARFNSERMTSFELLAGDTEGEPVSAALAARRLIVQEGASALLGGVLSNPTVAAAVEANARGVPLLSPSATSENIHELGDWIFQNSITSEAQVLALARLAILELLSSRFAVLYPNQGNGQALARTFGEVIYELGGELVASISYEVGMTDFSDPLGKIREAQPEVLFLPGEAEQLVLIVPQLAYHDIYAQLLGNEAWNSRRLARLGGERIEGAIFPSDVLLKRDRELFREFLRLYERRYTSSVNPIAARSFLGMSTLLEIMTDGALGRAQIREQLALRLSDLGDEAARREILAEQVTLMTVRDGEIRPYGSSEFFDPTGAIDPFVDDPWRP